MFVKLRLLLGQWLTAISKQLGGRLYLLLAIIFSIVIALDAHTSQLGLRIQNTVFDYLLKHRTIKPQADQNIVLIDIDEASLTTLNERLGSPPWSKQIFGELVEYLQSKQPNALVFNQVFDHKDDTHPDGDLYFSETVRSHPNTFFPIERADESKDFSSALQYVQIPSAVALSNANKTATLAAKTPYLMPALTAHQLGIHSVQRDFDGKARMYQTIHENQGWQIPSLAVVVSQANEANITQLPTTIYLNWRHTPYQRLSFHQIIDEMHSEVASNHQLKNKTVIIGTSADQYRVHQTILTDRFSNMELLATAIDNIQHQDYLKVWKDKQVYLILSLALIWLLALAFYYQLANTWAFMLGAIALFISSYIALNINNIYVATSAAILWAIAYFIPAKLVEILTNSGLQRWLSFGGSTSDATSSVLVMPILAEGLDKPLSDRRIRKIKQLIQRKSKTPCAVDSVKSIQSGIWQFLGDTLVVSWVVSTKNPAYLASAKTDAEHIINMLPDLTTESNLPESVTLRHALHEATLEGSAAHRQAAQWRIILAEAILKLEHHQEIETVATESPAIALSSPSNKQADESPSEDIH